MRNIKITKFFYAIAIFVFNIYHVHSILAQTGSGNLSIKTKQEVYTWIGPASLGKHFIVKVELTNSAKSEYYSKLSSGNKYTPLNSKDSHYSVGSTLFLEKFNEEKNEWKVSKLSIGKLSMKSPAFVRFTPHEKYFFTVQLRHLEKEKMVGRYRIRIDYFESQHVDLNISAHKDYSNTFEIK